MAVQSGQVDHDKRKPFNQITASNFIDDHPALVSNFLTEKFRRQDHKYIRELISENPVFFANLIKNLYMLTEDEVIEGIIDLVTSEGNVTVLVGAKRHGKTGVMFWLIEQVLARRPWLNVFWFGYSKIVKEVYPAIQQTMNTTKMKNGLLCQDETLLVMLGRDAMTGDSKDKVKLIPTIGHKGLSSLYLTQSFSLDPEILRQATCFWFKPYAVGDWDRESLRKLINIVKFLIPASKNENLILDTQTMNAFIFKNSLPAKWCEELSKPFSIIDDIKEAKEYAQMLEDAGFSERQKNIFIRNRGWNPEELW